MWAALRGYLKITALLQAHGANMNARDRQGMTAMMWAASKGQAATVRQFLDAGADPGLENNAGQTAATLAEKNRHKAIVEILESHRSGNAASQ
jgi:ankyrin repeat protein